jgi:hypothetical protein
MNVTITGCIVVGPNRQRCSALNRIVYASLISIVTVPRVALTCRRLLEENLRTVLVIPGTVIEMSMYRYTRMSSFLIGCYHCRLETAIHENAEDISFPLAAVGKGIYPNSNACKAV